MYESKEGAYDSEDDFELLKDCFIASDNVASTAFTPAIESLTRSPSSGSGQNIDLLSGDEELPDSMSADSKDEVSESPSVAVETRETLESEVRKPGHDGQEPIGGATDPEEPSGPTRSMSNSSSLGSDSISESTGSLMDLPLYVPPVADARSCDIPSTESVMGSQPSRAKDVSPVSDRSVPSSPCLVPVGPDKAPTVPPAVPGRGRMHTRPAWMTAELANDTNEAELEEMERQIQQVKQEVGELEQIILQKKKQRDNLRKQYAQLIQRPPAAPQVAPSPPLTRPAGISIVVELQKESAAPLGLSVGFDGSGFYVNEVKAEGSVPEWNRQRLRAGGSVVEKGDRIVEVNGVRGDKDAMTREFRCLRIRLVVLKGESFTGSQVAQFDPNQWPAQSLEAYQEIMYGMRNSGHKDALPRTGIMKYGDVPVRLPDGADGSFSCSVCGRAVRDWVKHFGSPDHVARRDAIQSDDYWTRYSVEGGGHYWYEHKIGFWSLDDPNRLRTGAHTVILDK